MCVSTNFVQYALEKIRVVLLTDSAEVKQNYQYVALNTETPKQA